MADPGLQNSKIINVTPPAAILDDASASTTEVDTAGFDHATYICTLGASDVAMAALAVTESDTSGSGHGNVTGLVFGTSTNIDGSTSALPSATDDNKVYCFDVDLRGRKRYLDLTATAGNGTTGTYFSAVCVLTRGESVLQTAAGRGCDEILRA